MFNFHFSDHPVLIAYVSDEYYAALAGVSVELFPSDGSHHVVQSTPSGALHAEVPAGLCHAVLAHPGFGSKRSAFTVDPDRPHHFRLLSDRLLGYAWPKWCRAGDPVQFRVHSVEPYKLLLHRHGLDLELIRNVGWYDNHGPRAVMQTLPDGHFVESGVAWDNGATPAQSSSAHAQTITAPDRSGLYYFHAHTASAAHTSFPLVVAPRKPTAPLAVLASTNTWNAYNRFGGRSNYILAAGMHPTPIVNAKSDLPRYQLAQYAEWTTDDNPWLSFDRPEPDNQVRPDELATDPIEGRQECHLAPAEWRTLAWLEREGFAYDLYADYQLHDGMLDLSAYRALLLNVHPEYWSRTMYEKTKAWVHDHSGRLIYLGGNGLNCAVDFDDATDHPLRMRCLNRWPKDRESRYHAHHESEANLLGVVFTDPGAMTVAPYRVVDPKHWAFADTGLRKGETFGHRTLHERYGDGASGHETDKRSPHSPANLELLAVGENPDEGGAHLSYYESPSGGAVFSAGSITYPTALLVDEHVSRITANVLNRFLAT